MEILWYTFWHWCYLGGYYLILVSIYKFLHFALIDELSDYHELFNWLLIHSVDFMMLKLKTEQK